MPKKHLKNEKKAEKPNFRENGRVKPYRCKNEN
jgi:hypothetical protein